MTLVDQIESAFGWRKLPKNVVSASALDSEITADAKAFQGKHFLEITAQDLRQYRDAVYGFSPEAFRYYLPGILIAGVKDSDLDLLVYSALLDELDRSNAPNTWDDFFIDRWVGLEPQEYTAILNWLIWWSDNTDDAYDQAGLDRAFDTIHLLMNSNSATPIAKGRSRKT